MHRQLHEECTCTQQAELKKKKDAHTHTQNGRWKEYTHLLPSRPTGNTRMHRSTSTGTKLPNNTNHGGQ